VIQRVRIVGQAPASFRDAVVQAGFSVDENHPDAIIAYGGDGTLIGAERAWPCVPKLGIRTDDTCVKCPRHQDDVVLDRLRSGSMDEEQLLKLEGTFRDHILLAVNDIIFRNADPERRSDSSCR
jgi:NAD kinase